MTFATGASGAGQSDTASEPARARKRLPPDRWWPIAWYPIAVPVAYIIAIWSASAIHPSWLLRPILVTVALVLLLTLVLSAALRDRHRGGLAASTLTLALLLTDERLRAVLLVLTILIIGDALINRGRRWRFGSRVTRFMSILSAALILVVVLSTIQQGTFPEAVADISADLNTRHADRTIALVDKIIATSKRDSVIVFFSDHGTDIRFNAADPLGSDLNERSRIVLAIRSPGRTGLLPAGTTPIAVLPRVLNAYLGTSLPLRADTLWGWPRDGSLLDAVPISRVGLRP